MDKKECDICFETVSSFKFMQCGHKLCNNCYSKIIQSNYVCCPFCRTKITIEKKIKIKNITENPINIANNTENRINTTNNTANNDTDNMIYNMRKNTKMQRIYRREKIKIKLKT
jgi:hypothetical protein